MSSSAARGGDELPADIWFGWRHVFAPIDRLSRVSPLEQLDTANLEEYARKLLRAIAWHIPAVLTTVAMSVRVERVDMEAALDAVALLAGPTQSFRIQRRVLEVIDAGNKAGYFAIPIPWVPAPMPPPARSPFVQADFERALGLQPLIAAYEASLDRSLHLSPDAWWGRVYFAAMFYGGLLNAAWLRALPVALRRTLDNELRWLDISTPAPIPHSHDAAEGEFAEPSAAPQSDAPANDTGLRRWIVDPLTRLLLAPAMHSAVPPPTARGRRDSERVMRCLHDYANAAGLAGKVPRDFRNLVRALKTRYLFALPPYLVEYATGGFANTSLPAQVWRRVLHPPSRRASNLRELPKRLHATPLAVALDDAPSNVPAEDLQDWEGSLRDLGSVIASDNDQVLPRLHHWRERNATSALPSVACVAEWVELWLLAERPGRAPLPPGKILQTLICVGSPLVAMLGDADPRSLLDEDAYIELYESVLGELKSSARRQGAAALRSFHDFLVAKSKAPELDSSMLFASPRRAASSVDANLIGVDTFNRAMEWLSVEGRTQFGPDGAECLLRVADLGFYAGLRRSEAIGLTLGDLRGTEDLVLTVTPNGIRRLKTRNAYRNIPLHVLLPGASLFRLRMWAEARRRSGATDSDPLFPMFWVGGVLVKNHRGLSLITVALIGATHDGNVRYHHLRHSFSSRLHIQFWLAEQTIGTRPLPNWLLPTQDALADLQSAQAIRRALLGTAPTNRRSLMQISRLLGHSSVEITLASYIHTLDIILGHAVLRLAPALPTTTLALLSDRHPKHVERILRGAAPQALTHSNCRSTVLAAVATLAVFNRRHRSPTQSPITPPILGPTLHAPPDDPYERLVHIANALHRVDATASNIASVAKVAGLAETDLRAWWQRVHSNHTQPGVATIYALPATSTQRALAAWTVTHVAPQLKSARALRQFLRAFAETQRQRAPMSAEFARVSEAKRWLPLLDALKPFCRAVWTHIPGRGENVPSASRQRQHWADALRVTIAPHPDPRRTCAVTRGSVELRCVLVDGAGKELGPRAQRDLVAIRFSLAMLSLHDC